jgi:hypothetical protein
MFNTLVSLMGSTIDTANTIAFLEQHGFKYPRKPFVSNRSEETSYWLENKKLGIDLLFEAQPYLREYPLLQGDKKGMFVPARLILMPRSETCIQHWERPPLKAAISHPYG